MARDKEPADREAERLEGIEGIEGVERVYISARCNLPRAGMLGAKTNSLQCCILVFSIYHLYHNMCNGDCLEKPISHIQVLVPIQYTWLAVLPTVLCTASVR